MNQGGVRCDRRTIIRKDSRVKLKTEKALGITTHSPLVRHRRTANRRENVGGSNGGNTWQLTTAKGTGTLTKRNWQSTIQKGVKLSAPLLKRMGVTPEEFERVALNGLVFNPAIGNCTPKSMGQAVVHLIQAGLLPDGKQAAIVPYGNTATVVPMIEGQIMLFRQAVKGASLRARLVYEDDMWEYEEGLFPVLRHKPEPTADRRDDKIIATYAVAHLPGQSQPEYEVMFRGEIDAFRAKYVKARNSPWDTHLPAMVKKTVLKQILKRLPKSSMAPPEPPAALEGIDLYDMDVGGPMVADEVDVSPRVVDVPTDAAQRRNDPPPQYAASRAETTEAKPSPRRTATRTTRPPASQGPSRNSQPNPPPADDKDDSPF